MARWPVPEHGLPRANPPRREVWETEADVLRKQLRESHVMVAAIILASGGTVVVTDEHIRRAYESEIERGENWDQGGPVITFRVRKRSAV